MRTKRAQSAARLIGSSRRTDAFAWFLAFFTFGSAAASSLDEFFRLSLEQPGQALQRGDELLATAEAQRDPAFQRDILDRMGHAAAVLSDQPALDRIIGRLDALAKTAHLDSALAFAELLRANRAIDQGRYEEGVRAATAAAATLARSGDPTLAARADGELCDVLLESNNNAQAVRHCDAAHAAYEQLGNSLQLARIENTQAQIENDAGRVDRAIALGESARARFEQLRMPSIVAMMGDNLAAMYLDHGQADKALALSKKALDFENAAGKLADAALSLRNIAIAQNQLGQHAQALKTIAEAIRQTRAVHFDSALPGMLQQQLAIADAAGDKVTALAAAKEALRRLGEQTEKESRRTMAELEAKYTALQKQHEIEQLELQRRAHELELTAERAENARQADSLERERITLVLIGVAAIGFGSACLLLVLLLRTQRRQSERLRVLSHTDSLTGAVNRRVFLLALESAFETARHDAVPAALLVVDADHFKAINDRHGHLAGDAALTALVDAMQGALLREATIGRLGGEEFGVVLARTERASALSSAEKLRGAIAAREIHAGLVRIPLTASLGVACIPNADYATAEQWLGAADRALYAAKHAGRNCVASAA